MYSSSAHPLELLEVAAVLAAEELTVPVPEDVVCAELELTVVPFDEELLLLDELVIFAPPMPPDELVTLTELDADEGPVVGPPPELALAPDAELASGSPFELSVQPTAHAPMPAATTST